MKNFLDNIFDFDEFETAFSLLYDEVRKEVDMFQIDLEHVDKSKPSHDHIRLQVLQAQFIVDSKQ